MSKAYTEAWELYEEYKLDGFCGADGLSRVQNCVAKAGIALVILATHSHTTSLEGGAVKVRFVERFKIEVKKETTAEKLLQTLAGQLVSIDLSIGKEFGLVRFLSGNFGFSLKTEEDKPVEAVLRGFLDDPMSAVPVDLKESVRDGLRKKAKSINRRLHNYDNEVVRRDKGRKSRAITSLTKVLAELDPEFQDLVVRTLRHNHTTIGKYGSKDHTIRGFLNAINTICSGNNLENWQDNDVISEAARLAGVHVVMNQ